MPLLDRIVQYQMFYSSDCFLSLVELNTQDDTPQLNAMSIMKEVNDRVQLKFGGDKKGTKVN